MEREHDEQGADTGQEYIKPDEQRSGGEIGDDATSLVGTSGANTATQGGMGGLGSGGGGGASGGGLDATKKG